MPYRVLVLERLASPQAFTAGTVPIAGGKSRVTSSSEVCGAAQSELVRALGLNRLTLMAL